MYASTRLSNRPHSSYIKMSDFIRIQNSIIPSKNNETNRKDIDASLKSQSKFHISHFPDTTKQTQKEYEEETYIQNEIRKRKIDEMEHQFKLKQNELINAKAKKNLFENQDDIKTFHSQLLYADVLKEREYQMNISKQKKEIEKQINNRYYQQQLVNMEAFDKKEQQKAETNRQKRLHQMKIINEQVQAQKKRHVEDYQEKVIEGILINEAIKEGIEEDKIKENKIKEQKQQQKELFIKANEDLQKRKEERKRKEKEEERKIEQFAIKKQQMEDLKTKVAKDKFNEKQKQRQKIIDDQIENLRKIKSNEERVLQKQIKEAEEKKEKEEEIKQKRKNELRMQMEESINAKRKEKEEEKLRIKKEEKEFVDTWKKRMEQLNKDEQEERRDVRNRNKEVAMFQIKQMNDKKDKAIKVKEHDVELAKTTKVLLKDEHDDYFEYVNEWIKEYQKQGKDITPLLLEIKRYKKRNNIV